MNLPRFSVQRPVFASMVALIVVVLGVVSLLRVRIDLLPAVEVPTLSVRTTYEGADPEVVERLVTQMVEEIIGTVPGVTELTSESSEGRSSIDVSFAWGTDIDVAATDVRARLEDELSELPEGIERPQLRKFDVASFPVVLLGITSSVMDPVDLNDLVQTRIRDRFARIPGVAQVDLWGGFERELRISLDPNRVRALGLSPSDIVAAIRASNVDLPAGAIDEGRFETVLRAPAEFASHAELRDLVLEVRDGAPITLGQVAAITSTHERESRVIRINDQPGIRVAIRKEADANTVEVSQRILTEIEAANAELDQVSVIPVLNQGNFIERSIDNVANSVLYGGALAVLVLLFFLRSVGSTVVIALAIPMAILATMALIFGAGLTLNLMTLGGLALGVGMMVDSSIVVLENIFRRSREHGEAPRLAAVTGSGEVAGALIASTITTCVIFLPLVFVEGVTGLLFQELALVVVFALIASLVVSLSLVPMLSARLLAQRSVATSGGWWARLAARAEAAQRGLDDWYQDVLTGALRRRLLVIMATLVALAASTMLWPLIGSEFLPPSDEGEVRVDAEFEAGTRLDLADAQARRIEALVAAAVPEAENTVASVSASGRRGDAAAESRVQVNVGPTSSRTRSNEVIADDLRAQLQGAVGGAEIRVRAPQGQFLLNRLLRGGEGLAIEIRGFDLDLLDELAAQVEAAIGVIPGITAVDRESEDRLPQYHLLIDRARVADQGLQVRAVAELLETGLAGRVVGDFRPAGRSVPIRLQFADAQSMSMDEILDQTIRTPSGGLVALRSLVTVAPGTGPAQIRRIDQQRAVQMTVETAERDEGSIAADIQRAVATIPTPDGYGIRVAGSYEEQQRSFRDLVFSFLLAIVLVYMVLACQYESLRDPVVVMVAVPVAAIGVLVTLFITRSTMNLQSGIGCIMLGGIVVNNAILLVDQATRLRREGMLTTPALIEAGRRRLRPILMTTTTTILGLLPLALGIGEGADAQAPLARAVIGGLIASTAITLLLVPGVYSLVHAEKPLEVTE